MPEISKQARAQVLASAAALLLFLNVEPLGAQGLQDKNTLDAIIGSPVVEEETRAEADPARVLAAIDKTSENTEFVRKASKVSGVDIVFLSDSTAAEGGPPAEIAARLESKKAEVNLLRQEIEGNAAIFHAIDSRQVLLKDVLALAFDDNGGLTVFAATAKPAN